MEFYRIHFYNKEGKDQKFEFATAVNFPAGPGEIELFVTKNFAS